MKAIFAFKYNEMAIWVSYKNTVFFFTSFRCKSVISRTHILQPRRHCILSWLTETFDSLLLARHQLFYEKPQTSVAVIRCCDIMNIAFGKLQEIIWECCKEYVVWSCIIMFGKLLKLCIVGIIVHRLSTSTSNLHQIKKQI